MDIHISFHNVIGIGFHFSFMLILLALILLRVFTSLVLLAVVALLGIQETLLLPRKLGVLPFPLYSIALVGMLTFG